jgi:hypothetical protein
MTEAKKFENQKVASDDQGRNGAIADVARDAYTRDQSGGALAKSSERACIHLPAGFILCGPSADDPEAKVAPEKGSGSAAAMPGEAQQPVTPSAPEAVTKSPGTAMSQPGMGLSESKLAELRKFEILRSGNDPDCQLKVGSNGVVVFTKEYLGACAKERRGRQIMDEVTKNGRS